MKRIVCFLWLAMSVNVCSAQINFHRDSFFTKELNFTKAQVSQLDQLSNEMVVEQNEVVRKFRSSSRMTRKERSEVSMKRRAAINKLHVSYRKKIDEKGILTKEQGRRLDQLKLWRELSAIGQFHWFLHTKIKEVLEISKTQEAKQRKTISEAEAKYKEAVENKDKELRKRLLAVLSESQRRKYKSIGFDYDKDTGKAFSRGYRMKLRNKKNQKYREPKNEK